MKIYLFLSLVTEKVYLSYVDLQISVIRRFERADRKNRGYQFDAPFIHFPVFVPMSSVSSLLKIGFLGAGRMSQALMRSLIDGKIVSAKDRLSASDVDEKQRQLVQVRSDGRRAIRLESTFSLNSA